MKSSFKSFAFLGAIALSAFIAHAQPYYLAGDFQGTTWDPGTNQMTGGPVEYDYTVTNQTPNALAGFKVTDGTWNHSWPGNNLEVQYDATGSVTIHFYPGSPNDGWLPLANRVGYDDPGNLTWGVAGDFDGWDGTQCPLTSIGNGVYSNSFVVATAQTSGFKFQSPPGSWNNIYFGADFGNNNANGSFTTTNSPQTVPFVLDLPHGRYYVGQFAPPPVTNQVVFAVDMTVQLQLGNFNPAADTVFVSGIFNGWAATSTNALVLTNYPTYDGGSNTNIYYATYTFVGLPGSIGSQYKFTCNDLAYGGSSGYEPISNNRSFNLLATNGILPLPVVKFGDAYLSDYLTADMIVNFTVNMTNATTYPDGHVFDPANDQVYINGNFLPGGWSSWDPISLTPMQNNPAGSEIYTYSAYIPAGAYIRLDYLYSIGYSAVTNYANEAPAYDDHFRDIRATATGTYNLPEDMFGNQYSEPDFGQLTAASALPGNVSVTWVGRPGIELQVNTNLSGSSWQTMTATDGTNWISGYSSTNGFTSQTNWPASSGQRFFRLIKSW